MKIGIPKEIKIEERRVSLIPAGAAALVEGGHTVYVEKDAGKGSGIADQEFVKTGAVILDTADEVWSSADMVIKVKEPLEPEFKRMREGQILFTYLHLAADEVLTENLLKRKIVGIAYETIQLGNGSLPLLAPMSAVAGRLSVQMGCACLETKNGGKGLLLSGVPGVAPARVTIVGGGISGINAAHIAIGMGGRVTILDIHQERLRYLDHIFHSQAVTLMSNQVNLEKSILSADLVIGAVLIPGARAPKLIKEEHIAGMEKGSAFVDIAIDQGGCAETSRPTTHDNPMYLVHDVVHYCVSNMPGAVPRTSTYALTNVTLPYVLDLANKGLKKALQNDRALARGLNVYNGKLTCREVADAFNMKYEEAKF
ncbi:MAG: alanine dehydrogenase [Desulfobacterales bacterium]